MKITDADLIKNGEKELIDAITGDLDWGAIESIFREKHNLGLEDDVEYKQGDLVVFDKKVAYKLQFDVKVTLSILFDRSGEFLSLSTGAENDSDKGDAAEQEGTALHDALIDATAETPDGDFSDDKEEVSQMASEIADMISDINEI